LKVRRENSTHPLQIGQFALPDNERIPPRCAQLANSATITSSIRSKFRRPEFRVRLGPIREAAAPVLMPEATVDKYDFAATWEREIGRAGQVPSVKTKAVPKRMKQPTDYQFRLGIGRANPRHDRGTLFARNYIHDVTPSRARRFAAAPLCSNIDASWRCVGGWLDHNFDVLPERGESYQKPL
jgi:hypothetical protein